MILLYPHPGTLVAATRPKCGKFSFSCTEVDCVDTKGQGDHALVTRPSPFVPRLGSQSTPLFARTRKGEVRPVRNFPPNNLFVPPDHSPTLPACPNGISGPH